MRVEPLVEPVVEWRHRDEVQGGPDPGDAQLEPEDHVQLFAFKPVNDHIN